FRSIKILTSNSLSMDINDFNFQNGIINIHVDENIARFIKINLVQKTSYSTAETKRSRYAIGINSLEVGFYSAIEAGELIMGPFKSPDEIYKVSIQSDMIRFFIEEPNIKLSISLDKEVWIPLQNSSVFDPDSTLSKIVNFNNVDLSSINTDEPVVKLFIKIEMQSINVNYISPESRNINRQTINASNSVNSFITELDGDTDFLELFKYTDIKFGSRVSILLDASSEHQIPVNSISFMESDGNKMLKGIGLDSEFIYNIERPMINDVSGNIVIQYGYDKIHVERNDLVKNIPTMDFDPFNIKIFEFTSILNTPISIQSVDKEFSKRGLIPVVPFNKSAGVYTLRYGNRSIEIDCKNGYFFDNREFLYAVQDDITEIVVYNEIGERVSILNPFTIDDVKYISLLEVLGSDITPSEGLIFNDKYPIVGLEANEYAIEFGKIVFGDYYKGSFNLDRVISSQIETNIDKVIDNFKLISHTSRQIKTSYQLLDSDLSTTIKLKHTNILEQSVSFDVSTAAINAFLEEVEYIDGQTEFKLEEEKVQPGNRGLNIIELDENYIDNGSITFSSSSDEFKRRAYSLNELIELGDYYIDTESVPNKILLPEDVYTDPSQESEIRYSVKPSKKSSSGLYSIDYLRGILHTVSNIDGETEIFYKYSSMYASYAGLNRINKNDYTISSRNITITIDDDKFNKYLLLSSNINKSNIDYLETPALVNFNLNIIDASNSI
ncbi:hypothetical protein N9242_07310, partial [Vicingaceae bacterium]|nr:hypothetical protein [Vicingaceae bacterium]